MKLISLEEVEKMLKKLKSKDVTTRNTLMTAGIMLKSLPTIDPIATIDEMIEEFKFDSSRVFILELYKERLQNSIGKK